MNQKEESATIRGEKVKKPYRKPAFRFERVFETSAAGPCGKQHGGPTQGGCGKNQKRS